MHLMSEREEHNLRTGSRWRRIRARHLRENPLCVMCLQDGLVAPATVADHIQPVRRDRVKLFTGRLQSLCKPHHDAQKQQIEKRGYLTDVGADGFPVDPAHPFNRQAGGGSLSL